MGGISLLIPIKWHILSWLGFIALYALYRDKIAGEEFGNGFDFLIFLVYHIVLFYVNAFWVLPLAFKKKKKVWYRVPLYLFLEVIFVLGLVIGASIVLGGLEISLDSNQPWQLIITNFFLISLPLFYGLILSLAFYGLRWGILQYKANRTAKHQNDLLLNAVEIHRQDWRKAQLNPHLLFSLLNTLRYITRHTPRETVHAMNILIHMMRYYVDKSPQGMILLVEEMKQVERLVELNSIRFGKNPVLQWHIEGRFEGIRIIPMLVLLLVENMLTHGVVFDGAYPATIAVKVSEKQLLVYTENRISTDKKEESTGNGLENLGERLQHFYPGRHTFHYGAVNGVFRVDVCISLDS